jgi:signal peptidase I
MTQQKVDTLSSNIENINNFINGNVGIVISVLESGNSVELKATGYSMFPTLRPGDSVVVKPLAKGELPVPGNVVVCIRNGLKAQRSNGVTEERHNGTTAQRRNGITEERYNNITAEQHNNILVMHRLIEIKTDDQNNPQLVTRGDSLNEPDKPWTPQQLLGVAIAYKRSEKAYSLKSYIPGAWRYKFNHRLIWFYIKMKNLLSSM